MNFQSKLPKSETNIFSLMSGLATEHQAINLGQGFPDFDSSPMLRELVAKHLNEGKNQYCPMPGLLGLRQTIATKLEGSYGRAVDPPTEICVTAGATQAIFTAIQAFVHSGDEVIILEPSYDCYKPAVQIAGGVPISYRMTYPTYQVDWDEVKALTNDRTRMIVINTPHNPTGTLLHSEDLLALEQIVAGKNIVVLSDEVYEHLIFDGQEHQSVLRFPALFEQSLAVYSLGKTLHTTGWKMGYIVGPESLISEFKQIHQWNVFCVNSFLQFAIADYLQEPMSYEKLGSFFQEKRDYLTNLLADLPLEKSLSKGTYFQLYDYSEISDLGDIDFAKYLTKEIGVAAIPVSPFYSTPTNDKVVRLCFAKKNETLDAAAERFKKLKS